MNPSPTPEQCLIALVDLANRAPKSATEMVGAQTAVNTLETALKRLAPIESGVTEADKTAPPRFAPSP